MRCPVCDSPFGEAVEASLEVQDEGVVVDPREGHAVIAQNRSRGEGGEIDVGELGHRQGVAVRVAVVGEEVGEFEGEDVVLADVRRLASGDRGPILVGPGDDRDGQRRGRGLARRVANGVAEHVVARIARRGRAEILHIGPAAVGVQHQRAVAAIDFGADIAGDRIGQCAGLDADDRQGVAGVDVGVVGEHIAARLGEPVGRERGELLRRGTGRGPRIDVGDEHRRLADRRVDDVDRLADEAIGFVIGGCREVELAVDDRERGRIRAAGGVRGRNGRFDGDFVLPPLELWAMLRSATSVVVLATGS